MNPDNTGAGEWSRGWKIAASGCIGLTLSSLHAETLGVLMQPLSLLFGWSRAEISTGVLIICICMLLFGPVVGTIIDRYGARPVALTGVTLFCTALAGIGLSGPSIWTWYLAWTFVGLSYPAVSTIVWTSEIGHTFVRYRGLALSIAVAGAGLANFVTPVFTVHALQLVGWRGVFFVLSAAGFLIALPLIWLLFRPISRSAPMEDGPEPAQRLSGIVGLKTLLTDKRFWLLATTTLMVSAGFGSLSIHFQPILLETGLSASVAASYASIMGPAYIIGSIGAGYLLDRLPANYLAGVVFVIPSLACFLLLGHDPSPLPCLAAGVFVGGSVGAGGNIIAYLVADYFGMKIYGLSYALIFGLYAMGYGLSPVVAGAVFDATKSYDIVLEILAGGLILSGALMACWGRRRKAPIYPISIPV